jgi:hypothetical protein
MAGRYSFSNAKSSSVELQNVRVETGMIVNVNPKNKTVDWASQYTGKLIPDLQVMSPYLHFNNGEGFTAMPEVQALCAVCWPSDGESPFIMGFLEPPESVNTSAVDGAPQTTTSPTSSDSDESPSDASYSGGRPALNPGDMYLQGRDDNFIVLRRGGVLQLGSTSICQRMYVPIRNVIRDFCENWEMNTASGSLVWQVHRQENDPTGSAPTELSLITREYAQDKQASIRVSFGALSDSPTPPGGNKTFAEIVIAPQNIDPVTGKTLASPVYVLRVDKRGNSFEMFAGTRTTEVAGDDVLTVSGNRRTTVKNDDNLDVGGSSATTIRGTHKISGDDSSVETWKTSKVIDAKVIRQGSSAASQPYVLGLELVQWLLTHTHGYGQPPPTQGPMLPLVLSKKIFGE